MLFRAALIVSFLSFFAAPTQAQDAVTPDGGRYYGPLVNGKLHGRGRIEWPNYGSYEGEFANGMVSGRGRGKFVSGVTYDGEWRDGMMRGRGRFEVEGREVYEGELRDNFYWGQGEVRYEDGRRYRGEFVRGHFEGKGRFESTNGDIHEGDFRKSEFTGSGKMVRKDGSRYEGEFRNWTFQGRGLYTDERGNTWEGSFVDGRLEGRGKAVHKRGTYEGEFKSWRYHGQGVLRLANGDVYRGQFSDGSYEGQGTLTFAKAQPDGRTEEKGPWRYGMPARELERADVKTNVETALYAQKDLLDKAVGALKPRQAGKINLYLLAIGGDGSQEVFRREVEFVQAEFARRFDTAGHSIALVNSRTTFASVPMATVTSIRTALKGIAARMDPAQDILFLFLTSHGSEKHELSLAQSGMELRGLPANELGAMLKESGIRWKVVVVSACYAGGFIDPLKDERTMIIAAAKSDRRSFGCADENDFTYFGRAFFKEALPGARSFQDAFKRAEVLVGEWERKDASDAAKAGGKDAKATDDERSLPQISSGKAIDAHLQRWWAQIPR